MTNDKNMWERLKTEPALQRMALAGLTVFVVLMISMWRFNVLGRTRKAMFGPKEEPKNVFQRVYNWADQKAGLIGKILVVVTAALLVVAFFQVCYYLRYGSFYRMSSETPAEVPAAEKAAAPAAEEAAAAATITTTTTTAKPED